MVGGGWGGGAAGIAMRGLFGGGGVVAELRGSWGGVRDRIGGGRGGVRCRRPLHRVREEAAPWFASESAGADATGSIAADSVAHALRWEGTPPHCHAVLRGGVGVGGLGFGWRVDVGVR